MTIDDLAKAAGVSRATAWRALKRPDSVSTKTRQRVQGAVASTGYVPNRLASALRNRSTGQVGLVLPELNYTFAPAAQAFGTDLAQHDVGIVFGITRYDPGREFEIVLNMLGQQVAALVLTGNDQLPQTLALLEKTDIPVVRIWSDGSAPGLTDVGFSNRDVGRVAARHLSDCGCTRVGMILTRNRPRAAVRAEAFRDEWLARNPGAATSVNVDLPEDADDVTTAMAELCRDGAPDGLFVNGDLLALQAINWCTAQGYRVPDDICILGFGNRQFSRFTTPPLSTIDIDEARIGERAAEAVLSFLRSENPAGDFSPLPVTLFKRGSTARAGGR